MADDIKIIVRTDVSSVKEAEKTLKRFEDASKTLGRSILDVANKTKRVASGWQQANSLYKEGTLNAKALKAAQTELARELAVLNNYTTANGRLNTQRALAELKAAQATRENAQAAEESAKATQRLADRQRELRMRFQEGYAQFTRQREAMRSLREAYRSNIITLAQYEAQLARIRAVNQGNVAGTNNLGVAMQQTGYQVGDFMVQIQSGQNPLVAFGQQATQLVGVLYLLPPATLAASTSILGLSVSVGFLVMSLGILIPVATAIGAYFMRMSGSSKTLSQRLDDLEATTQKVTSAFEMLADTELDQKFGDSTDFIRSMTSAMLGLNDAAQLQNLMKSIESIENAGKAGFWTKYAKGALSGLSFGFVGAGASEADEQEFSKLGFNMSLATFKGYTDNLKALAESGNRGGVTEAFTTFLQDATDNGAEVTAQGAALAEAMYRAALATAEVAAEQNGSAKAARVAAYLEEKRVESIGLYYDTLQKVSDLQEERKAGVQAILDAVEAEKRSMTDTLALNQLILKFGGDSVQVRQKEAEIAREQYRLEQMAAGIKGNHLRDAMALYDENAKVTAELAASEDKAKGLAEALKDAASAMASLLNMGSLEAKLAGLVAEVKAIETGANRVAAGYVASETVKAAQMRDTALAAGEMPQSLINQAYTDRVAKINEIGALTAQRDAGLAAQRESEKSGGGSKADPLATLIEEQRQRKILLGLTGEQRVLQEAIFQVTNKLGDAAKTTGNAQIEALAKENLMLEEQEKLYEEKVSKIQGIANTIGSSMETAFMSIVDGTQSAKDAFKSMAASIIKELYRVLVVQQLVGSFDAKAGTGSGIVGFFGKLLTSADGNVFSGGSQVKAFANGGIVGGPTYFPMSGGQTGLMGEAGPEAIMPLKRGTNGRLGVEVQGGGGSVNVTNNINVSGGSDPAAIRAEVAKIMPQITNATKAAVIDARRRGGQMKSAFR
jgi:hypothetical protein